MQKLLFVFVLLCQAMILSAQNIRIDRVHSENYCLGSELNIDVTISGNFAADNKFVVVAYFGWGENEQSWQYPATLTGNRLVTVLTEKKLAVFQRFGLRILSSSLQQRLCQTLL